MLLQLNQLPFPILKSNQQIIRHKSRPHVSIRCQPNINPSLIYKPSSWDPNFIECLDTRFQMEFKEKMKEMENKVIMALDIDDTLQLLELIDCIERLGLGYRFQNNIRRALKKIASTNEDDNLYVASLRFRLHRQHGCDVSQDFVRRFKDSDGDFMGCLRKDVKGLLSVYEASYLAFEEEIDLHDAKILATECLMKLRGKENKVVQEHINHALELPLYRRMPRLQARWSIDSYGKQQDANQLLLELATSDFNLVQSALKRDLQQVAKWWSNTGLASKLYFIRDRLMECFFFAVGVVFQPQYHCCRVELTKVCMLITTIDDIYDVYGSVDELKVFTDAVKRWDKKMVVHMSHDLQISFLALYHTINDMDDKASSSQGENIIPILAKVWGELCEAFLVEAKWCHNKYMPPLEEYLENAWQSVSGVVILTHAYFLTDKEIKNDARMSLEECQSLLKWSSMTFRLHNDLATSSDEIERGKTVNAISCYMHEKGVCEEVARDYIQSLIEGAWRKLIKSRVDSCQDSSDPLIEMAINLARISQCVYQNGDGIGAPDDRVRDRVKSVIIEPIRFRWWSNTGLVSKLYFIRDRLMECFFFAVGVVFQPQYHCCRVELTKVCMLITTIDDIYDVYGSVDELKVFTDAVKRWDKKMVVHMSYDLQISFLALYHTINDMDDKASSSQGENIIPILAKVWGELCEAFLVEAKWCHNKYMPPLEEYLENAWQSVSGVVILTHAYFLINNEIKNDARMSLEKFQSLLKWSSMIFRLYNDLATSTDEIERGKTVNAISCYMHENGVCEEVARDYIQSLIEEAWRNLIKSRVDSCQDSSDPLIEMAINLARISQCVYQNGDGIGAPDGRVKDRVKSVIIEPISIR